jgi:TatD DNase family protein
VGVRVLRRPPDASARAALPARRGAELSAGGDDGGPQAPWSRAAQVPGLVDSHAHVAEPEFDTDRAASFARAAADGVAAVVCVGASGPFDSNAAAVALAGRHEGVAVYAAIGIHPHNADTADDAAFAALAGLAARPGVVALGETGLDFHYENSPRPAQHASFVRHVVLARRLDLPLVIHVREAHAEAAALLAAEALGPAGGVIHCFTGVRDDARRYLDLGLHVSVAGIVTFKNADALRDAVRFVPADRLLIETDAPFLAPVPHRGKRNEPARVRLVAEAVARTRGEPFAAVAAATSANARRLFRLG